MVHFGTIWHPMPKTMRIGVAAIVERTWIREIQELLTGFCSDDQERREALKEDASFASLCGRASVIVGLAMSILGFLLLPQSLFYGKCLVMEGGCIALVGREVHVIAQNVHSMLSEHDQIWQRIKSCVNHALVSEQKSSKEIIGRLTQSTWIIRHLNATLERLLLVPNTKEVETLIKTSA